MQCGSCTCCLSVDGRVHGAVIGSRECALLRCEPERVREKLLSEDVSSWILFEAACAHENLLTNFRWARVRDRTQPVSERACLPGQ